MVQSIFHPVFSSHIFVNEVSVDWPPWPIDDDLEPIDNGGEGILEDIQRTLATMNTKEVQESEISQV